MVNTVRTQAYLTGTSFADGQAAGAIVPQNVRDLIVSTGTRCMVNVNDYGADPTGAADSTAAFQTAFAAGIVFVPSAVPGTSTQSVYRVSNCIVPNGGTLIGLHPPVYGGGGAWNGFVNGGPWQPPMIAPVSLSTIRLFNVDNTYGVGFEGLTFDCSNCAGFVAGSTQSCDAISGGSKNMRLRDLWIGYARYGLGGAVASSVATHPDSSNICAIENCNVVNCVMGVRNILDGWIRGGVFGSNYTAAIYLNGPNASAVDIQSVRMEWNGRINTSDSPSTLAGSGIYAENTGSPFSYRPQQIQVRGCYFDTNGVAGINMNAAEGWTITGNLFQASGCNPTTLNGTTLAAGGCHINFNGCNNIVVTGNISPNLDMNTDVSTLYSPQAFANFAGTNQGIVMSGNDMSGYTGSNVANTPPPTGGNSSPTLWFTGTSPATVWVGTGSIASNTLTVSTTTSGTLAIGTILAGARVVPGTVITAGSGASWTVNVAQAVTTTTMLAHTTAQAANGMIVSGNLGTGGAAYDINST